VIIPSTSAFSPTSKHFCAFGEGEGDGEGEAEGEDPSVAVLPEAWTEIVRFCPAAKLEISRVASTPGPWKRRVTGPVGKPVSTKWPKASVVVEMFIPTTLTAIVAPVRAAEAVCVDIAATPGPTLTVPSIVAVPEGARRLAPPHETRAKLRVARPRPEALRAFFMKPPEQKVPIK
jgi:hypothetical protein